MSMNPTNPVLRSLLVMTAAFLLPLTGLAVPVTVGQIDTFESGTTNNWVVGLLGAPHPAPPVNVGSGGPAGVDDNYLLVTAIGGGGAGSRLSVINISQWSGDYIAAGIGGIRMDVRNFGQSDLDLRLLLADPLGGPPTNIAFSSLSVPLAAGSGWTSIFIPVGVGDLSAALGSVDNALRNATELRIYHSTAAGVPGPAIVASLGIDNIQAVAGGSRTVPDAGSSAGLLALGILGLVVARRSQAV
jgi:hypothetical protein